LTDKKLHSKGCVTETNQREAKEMKMGRVSIRAARQKNKGKRKNGTPPSWTSAEVDGKS